MLWSEFIRDEKLKRAINFQHRGAYCFDRLQKSKADGNEVMIAHDMELSAFCYAVARHNLYAVIGYPVD